MKAIAKCKIQKSPGPDQIPYEVWKMMPVGVLYRVARLFDQFVIQNETPARWDTAKGIPLFKKGDETAAYPLVEATLPSVCCFCDGLISQCDRASRSCLLSKVQSSEILVLTNTTTDYL